MKQSFFWVCLCAILSHVNAKNITVHFDHLGNIIYNGTLYSKGCERHDLVVPGSSTFWMYVGVIVFLTLFAGMVSGLTVGLLSIDPLKLAILQLEGTADEKNDARKVAPLVKHHHLLLVTLLLCNAVAMEALPIFLDYLVPSYVAIIISVSLVLMFGEVIPQALCTGPRQLAIAASFAPVVNFLIVLTFAVSYPISSLLDCILGPEHDDHKFRRSELRALISLHGRTVTRHGDVRQTEPLDPEGLHPDEIMIIHGALSLQQKSVSHCMVPASKAFMLASDTVLNFDTMATLLACGHSRVPIYHRDRNNVKGILLVKRLIVVDPSDNRPVRSLALRKPLVVDAQMSLFDILNEFQKGQSHMAIVVSDVVRYRECLAQGRDALPDLQVLGLLSIEDVIEEILQEEIADETDPDDKYALALQGNKSVRMAATKFKSLLIKSQRRSQLLQAEEDRQRLKRFAERRHRVTYEPHLFSAATSPTTEYRLLLPDQSEHG